MTIDCCQTTTDCMSNRIKCFLDATDCRFMTIDCFSTKIKKTLFSKILNNLNYPSLIILSIYSKYYFNKLNAWLKIVLSTKSIRSKISYTLSHKSWNVDLDQWILLEINLLSWSIHFCMLACLHQNTWKAWFHRFCSDQIEQLTMLSSEMRTFKNP